MSRSLACLLALAPGCSAPVPTSSLGPSLGVTAVDHKSTFVSASLTDLDSPLRSGGRDMYMLSDGESWVATLGEESKTLELLPGTEDYRNSFAADPGAGDQLVVALHRHDAEDAPQSVFTFPQPLHISAPTTASRAKELAIAWSPSGLPDQMAVHLSSDCIPVEEPVTDDIIGDPGMVTFPANMFHTTVDTTDACDLTVQITRFRAAVLDPHFDPYSTIAYAGQSVTATITTTQ